MTMGSYCFDVDAFAQDGFDVALFLEECRTRNPMETIHQDLRAFQTVLENQLVAIINQDYAEFLQLSSRLKGVDEAVSSVRSPLLAVLKRVDLVEQVIQSLSTRVHGAIHHEEELRKMEAELELSIRVSEKLLLLEQLLEITSFEDADEDDASPRRRGPSSDADTDADTDDDDDGFDNFERVVRSQRDGSAEACAMLERATQLLIRLDLEFLDGVDIPSVQREEKRITVIEDTLLRRLETEFATEVFPDTFYNRDHAISASRLSFLLRSYVMLQKSHIPEDMIARLLVQPFADENITRGKLDGRVRGSCEGLQLVYDEIREFITSKFGALLELPVCQGERKASVDLLGNAIWKPLFEVLSSKHAVVFKSSDADRFHHNYSISMKFLASLEDLCGTEQMKQRFRSHESVVEFKEKWNMDVYFQLRYNQLVAELDTSFGAKRSENGDNAASSSTRRVDGNFLFPCTRTLWEVMLKCWDHDVFLQPLLPEFTKLCLQLLLHFVAIWQEPLDEAVEQLKGPTKANFTTIQFTCLTSEEDVVCAGNDFHLLCNKLKSELLPLISQRTQGLVDDSDEFARELYEDTLATIALLEQRCWEAAASTVTDECKKVLPALRTVKGQYQMTSKPPPTSPSTFVPNIARPLEEFLDRWGSHFVGDAKQDFVVSIVDPVCELYHSLSAELLKSAQELEDSLKSRKMQRNAPSGVGGSNGMTDTQKMREQLRLDLEEFQRIVSNLGVTLEASQAFVACRNSLCTDEYESLHEAI